MFSRFIVVTGLLVGLLGGVQAQTPMELLKQPDVQAAMQDIQKEEPHFIDEQVRICEIAAPPFHEEKRAEEMAKLFREAGLANVRIDHAGNILGDRLGKSVHPAVVMGAHLDTVFPPETNVRVTRNGNLLKGPGIADDCRGLAALLAVIHALQVSKIETSGSITFVADVGEEGLGDLRGMKELFETTMKDRIDAFIAVEPGPPNRLTIAGVGSYRYKVTYRGPGGHSYGAFGSANPIHALGRAIAHIDELQVPSTPKTTFNVGRIGGGTSVNSISAEAWMEVDERSVDSDALNALDAKLKSAVQAALQEENARWENKGKISAEIKPIGLRPAGHTSSTSSLVKLAAESIQALQLGNPHFSPGSTDSNVPMNLHIPAITIGGGGNGTGSHSLEETDDVTDSWKGVQNAFLTLLSVAR